MRFGLAPRTAGIAVLVFAQLNIGAAAVFVRFALTGTGPMTAACLRVAFASAIVLAIAVVRRVDLRRPSGELKRLLTAGCMLGLHFASWIAAFRYTSVAVATLLVCTTPFGLMLFEALRTRRLPPLASAAALPVAAAAMCAVIFGGATAAHAHKTNMLLGAALSLLGAAFIGCYLLLMRAVGNTRSTLSVVAITYPSALLVLVPLALAAHEHLPTTAPSWGGVFGMVVFAQLLGHTAIAASLKYFTPSTVAFATLAEPPIAAALAAIVLGERLTPAVIAGGAVLLAAIGVVLAHESRPYSEADFDCVA